MDIEDIASRYTKPTQNMRYTIGEQIHFIMPDFNKFVKKFKHEKTHYMLYEVKIISRNKKEVSPNNHHLQIPIKTVWLQIHNMLKEADRLQEKNIPITIIRDIHNNYHYDITIHDR